MKNMSLAWIFLGVCTLVCLSLRAGDEVDRAKPMNDTEYVRVYRYPTGEVMLQEFLDDTKVTQSVWYSRTGNVHYRTLWRDGNGISFYLRDDGTLRFVAPAQDGFVHGPRLRVNKQGIVESITVFDKGENLGEMTVGSLIDLVRSQKENGDSVRRPVDPYRNPFDPKTWEAAEDTE